ncbi:hypothetical protein M1N08_00825 [Dehalococcoidia bacterium]|nr:hypothetical protein [Dehalococcoidia bacterium]
MNNPAPSLKDYEAKLVIGRKAKEYILGYTFFNDMSERQRRMEPGPRVTTLSRQWGERKVDPDDLKIKTTSTASGGSLQRTGDLIQAD